MELRMSSLAFVIQIQATRRGAIETELRAQLRGDLVVEDLFEDQGHQFIRAIVTNKAAPERAAWFSHAYDLRRELNLESCEPDLASDYFFDDAGELRETAVPGHCKSKNVPPPDHRWLHQNIGLAGESIDGLPAVIIGQPDTGITLHEELPATALDLSRSWDFYSKGPGATDPLAQGPLRSPGHGTGTGSVIIASGEFKLLGSAPSVRLVPLRCIKSVIRFEQSRVAEAVKHAVDKGCHILSMSLGGLPSGALRTAIAHAITQNVIVVAAAGNCVNTVVYPARYGDCIAVAGSNVMDQPWCGSCFGDSVTISAPAEHVWRARPSSPEQPLVAPGEGTSYATAITAGVAAKWIAKHSHAKLVDIARRRGVSVQAIFRRALKVSARKDPPLPRGFGAGILNVPALLALDPDDVATRAAESAEASGPHELLRLINDVMPAEELESAPSFVDATFELEVAALALDRARDGRNRQPPSQELADYSAQPGVPRGVKRLVSAAREEA